MKHKTVEDYAREFGVDSEIFIPGMEYNDIEIKPMNQIIYQRTFDKSPIHRKQPSFAQYLDITAAGYASGLTKSQEAWIAQSIGLFFDESLSDELISDSINLAGEKNIIA